MKTTKVNFEYFKSECMKWIERYHLNEWSTSFEWSDLEANTYAQILTDSPSRSATVRFCKDWPQPRALNRGSIAELALHEATHLLLGKYWELATARYVRKGEIVEAEEEVVTKLARVMGSIG